MSGATPTSRFRSITIKAVISIAILFALFSQVDFAASIRALRSLSPAAIVVALLLFLFAHSIGAIKWKILLRPVALKVLFAINLGSQIFSFTLPGFLGADIYRLKRTRDFSNSVSVTRVLSSLATDRVLGIVALVPVTVLSYGLEAGGRIQFLAFMASGAIAAFPACLGSRWLRPCEYLILSKCRRRRWRATRTAAYVFWCLAGYLRNPAALYKALACGVIFQLAAVAICFVLACDLGIEISFYRIGWVFGVVSVIALIPVSLSGLGVAEASMVGILASLGYSPEASLSLSLGILCVRVVGSMLATAMGEFLLSRCIKVAPGVSDRQGSGD